MRFVTYLVPKTLILDKSLINQLESLFPVLTLNLSTNRYVEAISRLGHIWRHDLKVAMSHKILALRLNGLDLDTQRLPGD